MKLVLIPWIIWFKEFFLCSKFLNALYGKRSKLVWIISILQLKKSYSWKFLNFNTLLVFYLIFIDFFLNKCHPFNNLLKPNWFYHFHQTEFHAKNVEKAKLKGCAYQNQSIFEAWKHVCFSCFSWSPFVMLQHINFRQTKHSLTLLSSNIIYVRK